MEPTICYLSNLVMQYTFIIIIVRSKWIWLIAPFYTINVFVKYINA